MKKATHLFLNSDSYHSFSLFSLLFGILLVALPASLSAQVTFTALDDLSVNAGVQTGLSGGTPTGGVYTGAGVTDDGNFMTYTFDPAAAGVGVHTLTYTVGANSASDDVEVLNLLPPAFSKSFDITEIGPGSVTTLTFTIDNSASEDGVTDLDFTDNLPAGMTIATPANVINSCGLGTVTAPDGGTTISFTDGTLGASSSCTISVDVTSSTPGTHTNTTGDLNSSSGNSGTATADLTVSTNRPGFSKSFSPGSVNFGERSTLTFTIDNSANTGDMITLNFTDNLPPGMVIASPPNIFMTCDGGILTADPGTSIISLTDNSFGSPSLAAGATCTISVDVVGSNAGTLNNLTGNLTGFNSFFQTLSSGKASAALEVVTPTEIFLQKSFNPNPAAPGGTTNLEFTITNFSRDFEATNITFTDDLTSVLAGLIATGTPLNDVCGTGSQISGTTNLTFTGGTIPAEGSCTFSVPLSVPAGAAGGIYSNTTGAITGDLDGTTITGNMANENLTIAYVPTITKDFLIDPIVAGGVTTLEFTITNTDPTNPATDISFSDDFSAFLSGATITSLPAFGSCGASSVFTYDSFTGLFQMNDGEIAAGSSCNFSIDITIPTNVPSGIYNNTTSFLSSTIDGEIVLGNPASDDLEVLAIPQLSKSFTDDPVNEGDIVNLEFEITYDEFAIVDATAISFTDDLNAVISGLAAIGLPINDVCGVGSQISGTTNLSFTGGTMSPGDVCTFSVPVQVPAGTLPGTYLNTTSTLSSTVGGQTGTSDAATDNLLIGGLTLTKEFIDDPTIPGDLVTLRFMIDNTTSEDATSIVFTDNLGAVLPGLVAEAPLPTMPCGATNMIFGTNFLIFLNGEVSAGTSCSFDVNVRVPAGATSGTYTNVTSNLTATMNGMSVVLPPATDVLEVNDNFIALSKTFTDDPVLPGGTVTVEYTLTNLDPLNAVSNIAFTDDFDALLPGLQATGLPMTVCGGTVSGTGLLSFTGGSLAAGASCTFSVTLQTPINAPYGGSLSCPTSEVSGDINGFPVVGDPASDNLDFQLLQFSKSFAGDVEPGGSTTLTFTITNPDPDNSVNVIRFTDDLDAVLSGMIATNLPLNDICGPGSSVTGTSTIVFDDGVLDPGQSCTFDVIVEIPCGSPGGSYMNTTSVISADGIDGDPATDDLTVLSVPVVSFTALADICVNAGLQTGLGGGTPTGGVYSGAGVTDNGNGETYDFDPAVAGAGAHTITYTGADSNGCTNSASDDVEVFPLPSITFTAPADLCVNAGVQAGLSGGTPTGSVYSGTGVTDDVNGMTYSFDPVAAGVGTHTITQTYTEVNGCTASASDDIEVFALPVATFTALADLCIDAGIQAGLGGGTPTGGVYSGAGVTDNGDDTYDFDPVAAGVGVQTLTYSYTDANGCAASASDDVEVFALPVVTFTALADLCIDAGVQAGLGGGTPTGGVYSGTGVTDDANGETYSFDPASAGAGVHTLTYTYTDGNGCTNSASDDVEVFSLPVVTFTALADLCIDAGVQAGLGGGIPIGGVYSGDGVTDDTNGMTYSFDPASAGVGVHTLTYTYTDANGCTASASDDVEVFALPVVTFTVTPVPTVCVMDSPVTGLGGGTPSGGVYSGLGVTDDGNGMTFTFDPTASAPAGGNITVIYTFTDANGCTNSATDDIFVNPICCQLEVTCPTVTDLGTFDCQTINNLPSLPVDSTDATEAPYNIVFGTSPCGTILVDAFDDMMVISCGLVNQLITRTVFIWDDLPGGTPGVFDAGLEESSSCVFTFVVVPDLDPPSAVCPPDMILNCDESTDPANTGMATAVDNCDPAPVIISTDVLAPVANGYTITRTWTAEDNCGNVSMCDQIITVISCDFNITDPCVCVDNASVIDLDTGLGGDDGQFSELVAVTGPGGAPIPPNPLVTFEVVAMSGGVDAFVPAPIPPAQTPGDPILPGTPLPYNPATGHYELPFYHYDGIGYSITVQQFVNGLPGVILGPIENNCVYPNPAFDPVIEDLYCPNAPAVILAGIDLNGLGADNVSFTIDMLAATQLDPSALGIGLHTVQMIWDGAADGNGGISPDGGITPAQPGCIITVQKMFEVNDTESPMGTCPDGTDYGNTCLAVAPAAPLEATVAAAYTDNCGMVTATLESSVPAGDDCAGWTITHTYTISDGFVANDITCVIVDMGQDTGSPTMVCQPVTLELDVNGMATLTTAAVDNGSSDNCGGPVALSLSMDMFTCTNLGPNDVWLIGEDECGNIDSCMAVITVEDNIAPTITCPDDIEMPNDFGVCGAVVTFDVVGDDNCDFTITQTAGIPSGGFYPVGETMNTFMIEDAAGATAECSFLVTINDEEGPMIDCPSDFTVQLEAGECEELVLFDVPFMDNCGTIDAEASQAVNEALVSTALDCAFNTSNHLRYFENNLLVPVEITEVNFGVFNSGFNETVTVNVYMIGPGAVFTYANMVLMGTVDHMVPAGMNQVILTAAVEATIPVGMNYVLELKANNTTNFVIGYNTAGETESTYISGNPPVPCVSLEPVDIDVLGFGAFAVILYSNAEGGPFIEQTGGLPSGSYYPIGTTTNTFKATDVYGNMTICEFDVTLVEFENGVTGAMACNDLINVSLDQNCELELNADMLLEGDIYGCYDDYIINVSGGVGSGIITEPGTYTVTITDPDTGNSCWSTINVESKAVPVIDCAAALCPIDMLEGEWTADDNTFSPGAAWAFDGFAPNNNILYDEIEFVVTVPGVYTLTMTPSPDYDGIAGIYAGSFDPDMPALNLIGGDDDVPGIFESEPDFMIFLDAGNYILVSSTWGAGQMGIYTWSFSGPGDLLSACDVKCYELDALLSGDLEIPDPAVTSCIPYELYYSDAVDYDDCGTTTVTRTYLAENANGSSTCEVTFEIDPVSVALDIRLPEALVVLTCNDGTDPADIVAIFDNPLTNDNSNTAIVENNEGYIYAYPTYEVNGHPQKVDNNVCNVYAAYTDQELDACAEGCLGNRKIIRTWTLVDWCTLEITNFIQTIKAIDIEAPTLITKDITVSTDAWGCAATFEAPLPWELHDNCDSNPEYRITGPAGVAIDGTFEDGYTIIEAPKGTHTFNYIAYDCCDNEASYPFTVTALDLTPPVVVAKQNVVISLTSGSTSGAGLAKLYAESIDNGSYDGCSSTVKLEIRRDEDNCDVRGNATYNADGHPQDGSPNPNSPGYDPDGGAYVKFCCADLDNAVVDVNGDGELDAGYVKVWLRVWDDGDMDGIFGTAGDNYNEAWAFVKVEDKLAPAIQCPPDVTLTCDMDYTDLNMTGSASAFGSCGGIDVEYNDIIVNLNACNEGFVRRRWNVVGRTDIFCDQTITLEDLDMPVNVSFSQVQDFTAANCPDMIALGEPTWVAGPCDVIGYTMETDTFKFEDGACYKLVNYWTVINWCDYDPNNPFWDGSGLWEHVQVIKVTDETKPVLEDCEDKMYAINDHSDSDDDGEVCEAKITLTNVATDPGSDNCPTGWLKWQVFVDLWGDGTDDLEYSSFLPPFDNIFNDTNGNGIGDVYVSPTANGETVSIPLPDIAGSMSNHKVRWKVTDGCNNVTTCDTEFMVVDKKAPTPYCVDLSTAVMESSGTVELWAIDFNVGSFDNCTAQEDLRYTFSNVAPEDDPNYDESQYSSSMVFDCGDVENSPVEVNMYVWDEKGNADFCIVFLTIVDNTGACGGKPEIGGTVATATGEGVNEVAVTLEAALPEYPRTEMTDGEGVYVFLENALNANYQISGSKDVDYMNGVSTLDLVKIQRHILGLEELDSPYKLVAADVNADDQIKASDLTQLRKLILGVITDLPTNESWRFVDGAQDMSMDMDLADIDYTLNLDNVQGNSFGNDMVAVKVGDVTNNAVANLTNQSTEVRSSKTLELNIENQAVEVGQKVTVDFMSEDFTEVYGYQFTMELKGLSFAGIENGAVEMTEGNVGVLTSNVLTMSYNNTTSVSAGNDATIFSLDFIATQSGNLSEMIDITSKVTRSEAYVGQSLEIRDVVITTRGAITEVEATALYQNEPNPFKGHTVVGFNLAEAGAATMTVFDVTGKVIVKENIDGVKGYNTVNFTANQLGISGVCYYTLESGDFTATKKMIIIE